MNEAPPQRERDSQPLSLRRNFAWTFSGNLMYAACQWGILVVLAKLGTAEMVGQFVLGLAVSAPVFMFAGLQLRLLQATDRQQEYQFGEYLGVRLLAAVLALGITAAIACGAGYRAETLAVIILVGVTKLLESISDIFYGLLQQHERMDRVAKSMLMQGAVTLSALAAGLALTGSIAWGLVGTVAARLLMLPYDVGGGLWILRGPVRLREASPLGRLAVLRPSWDLRRLGRLSWLAFPLAASTLLVSLNTNIPRYFVAHYESVAALGIFGAISALMIGGGTITRALNQASSARLAAYYAGGNMAKFRALFLKTLLLYSGLGLAGVTVAFFAGGPLLGLLFQPEYAEYVNVLLFVMLALAVAYLSGAVSAALITVRCIAPQIPLQCLTVLTTLAACALFVPRSGLEGAALAMAVGRLPFLVFGMLVLLRATRSSRFSRPLRASSAGPSHTTELERAA